MDHPETTNAMPHQQPHGDHVAQQAVPISVTTVAHSAPSPRRPRHPGALSPSTNVSSISSLLPTAVERATSAASANVPAAHDGSSDHACAGMKRPLPPSSSSSSQRPKLDSSNSSPTSTLPPLYAKLSKRPSIAPNHLPVLAATVSDHSLSGTTGTASMATGTSNSNASVAAAAPATQALHRRAHSTSKEDATHLQSQLRSSFSSAASATLRAQHVAHSTPTDAVSAVQQATANLVHHQTLVQGIVVEGVQSHVNAKGYGSSVELILPRATSAQSLPETSSTSSGTSVAGSLATALKERGEKELAGCAAHDVARKNSEDGGDQNRSERSEDKGSGNVHTGGRGGTESNNRREMVKSLSCPEVTAPVNPQTYLDAVLKCRGYDTNNYCSLETGYYCKPTPHQKASYGMRLIQAVRSSDPQLLHSLLQAGLSRNPCNAFGESIVHMVCRRGDLNLLQVLVESGTSLQVSDDFGRTPLHDACWTAEPNFDVVDIILRNDSRLLRICDCRGASPLSYVKRDNYVSWVDYLNKRKEEFWPARDVSKVGTEGPPALVGEAPHTRPIADPTDAAPLDLVAMVASGRMGPEEANTKRTGDVDVTKEAAVQAEVSGEGDSSPAADALNVSPARPIRAS